MTTREEILHLIDVLPSDEKELLKNYLHLRSRTITEKPPLIAKGKYAFLRGSTDDFIAGKALEVEMEEEKWTRRNPPFP